MLALGLCNSLGSEWVEADSKISALGLGSSNIEIDPPPDIPLTRFFCSCTNRPAWPSEQSGWQRRQRSTAAHLPSPLASPGATPVHPTRDYLLIVRAGRETVHELGAACDSGVHLPFALPSDPRRRTDAKPLPVGLL